MLGEASRSASQFYEQNALSFVVSALKTATYLNAGGILAIPTAISLFKVNIVDVTGELVASSLCFVSGIVCVAISYTFAFFVNGAESGGALECRTHNRKYV